MERDAQRFLEQSKQANQGRSRAGRRYTVELRHLAVSYLEQCLRSGRTRGSAARKLGVSEYTLKRWQEEEQRNGGLRRVEVVERESTEEIVLVTPEGYRVEGLTEPGLIRLLDQLR
jgi:transposase-like protein